MGKLIKKREDKIRKIEIERYRKDRYTESDIYIHIKIHTFMYIFIYIKPGKKFNNDGNQKIALDV